MMMLANEWSDCQHEGLNSINTLKFGIGSLEGLVLATRVRDQSTFVFIDGSNLTNLLNHKLSSDSSLYNHHVPS